MSESRICPVCENEIPEDTRYYCTYCSFDLEMIDNEEAIEIARKSFTGELFNGSEKPKKEPRPSLLSHVLVGILWEIIILIIIIEDRGSWAGMFISTILFLRFFPIILLAAGSSYLFEKVFRKYLLRQWFFYYLLTPGFGVIYWFLGREIGILNW